MCGHRLSKIACVPICLSHHKKTGTKQKENGNKTNKNNNGGDEEGDAEERIKVGRKVQKIVNQRIHKKACLLACVCLLFSPESNNVLAT